MSVGAKVGAGRGKIRKAKAAPLRCPVTREQVKKSDDHKRSGVTPNTTNATARGQLRKLNERRAPAIIVEPVNEATTDERKVCGENRAG